MVPALNPDFPRGGYRMRGGPPPNSVRSDAGPLRAPDDTIRDAPRLPGKMQRFLDCREGVASPMNDEKITVRVTSTGQTLEVVVLNKRVDAIEIVLGEGVHSVRCRLSPTRNGLAYAGNAMGREIVYERARGQVKADLERVSANQVNFKRR